MKDNDYDWKSVAREKFASLEPSEVKLCENIISGQRAVYRVDSSSPEAKRLNSPKSAAQWGSDRTLSANVVTWLCKTSKFWNPVGGGVIDIRYAKIVGELQLDNVSMDVVLRFLYCSIQGTIFLRNATLRTIDLEGTYLFPTAFGSKVQVGLTGKGEKLSEKGPVAGQVNEAASPNKTEAAEAAPAITTEIRPPAKAGEQQKAEPVTGGLPTSDQIKLSLLTDKLKIEMGVDLLTVLGPDSKSKNWCLRATEAEINGSVRLNGGFRALGIINFDNSKINGSFQCSDSRFFNINDPAFTAKGADIIGDLSLDHGFEPNGDIDLRRIKIGGRLTIDPAPKSSDAINSWSLAVLCG
jgi:hypothetical protein